jgi:heme A synthase
MLVDGAGQLKLTKAGLASECWPSCLHKLVWLQDGKVLLEEMQIQVSSLNHFLELATTARRTQQQP